MFYKPKPLRKKINKNKNTFSQTAHDFTFCLKLPAAYKLVDFYSDLNQLLLID
jgi:hypothetical protein